MDVDVTDNSRKRKMEQNVFYVWNASRIVLRKRCKALQ